MLYDLNGSSDEDEDADFHSHDDQQKPASHVGQQKPASRAEPGTSSNQLIDLVSDDDDNADIARRLQAEEDKSDADIARRLQVEEDAHDAQMLARSLQAEEDARAFSTIDSASSKRAKHESPPRRSFPAETSVYTQALDAALATAATAAAASGAPLFDAAERELIASLTSLAAAHRLLLARLIFVTGPWSRWSGRAAVCSYCASAADAHAAVDALEAAGAMVRFSASSSQEAARELLPCLVTDQLSKIRTAAKKAAKAAARAEAATSGGGVPTELKEAETASTAEDLVSRILELAARYQLPLVLLVASGLAEAADKAAAAKARKQAKATAEAAAKWDGDGKTSRAGGADGDADSDADGVNACRNNDLTIAGTGDIIGVWATNSGPGEASRCKSDRC